MPLAAVVLTFNEERNLDACLAIVAEQIAEIASAGPRPDELARANGCEYPIVTRNHSFAETTKQLTGGRGADVIYDGLGRDAAAENRAALARRGLAAIALRQKRQIGHPHVRHG